MLNKTQEDILTYREAPEKFEEVKTELLGNQVKFVGRVVNNTMFNRLEFISNQVFPNPNPEEEIERLSEESKEEAKPEEPKEEMEVEQEEIVEDVTKS